MALTSSTNQKYYSIHVEKISSHKKKYLVTKSNYSYHKQKYLTQDRKDNQNKIKCKECNAEFQVKDNEFKSNETLSQLIESQSYLNETEIKLTWLERRFFLGSRRRRRRRRF
jgi:hypothetical protein